MKKAVTITFFVCFATLVVIVYINIINNKVTPKVVFKDSVPLNESYQDSVEELSALPKLTVLREQALYDASQIK